MTKLEFMKELESLLSDIPLEEREEALQYYNGYFDDAGEDKEQDTIKELGSPQRVAQIIKADLNSNAADRENRGCFTENGYQETSYHEEKFELIGSGKKNAGNGQGYNSEAANRAAQERTRNTNIALLIIVCIVGFPFIASAFGIVVGIISAILGIIIGFAVAGAAMIVSGIALIVVGLIKISVPMVGLLFCGSGFVVLGLGMIFFIVSVILCKNVLPAMIKGIVNLCRRPFQNRSVAA